MNHNENAIAKFHNNISEARYKLHLSEQKMYIFAVQQIDQDRPDFETVEFTIKDMAEQTGMDETTLYREIGNMADNILSTVITAQDPNGDGWEKFQMASFCKHIKSTGYVEFRFHEVMKPFLLELKEHYFIQAPQVIKFKSTHSIKLYDFIEAQTYNKSECVMTIEDFKDLMGLEGQYNTWQDLKKRVIEIAVKEINSKTDIELSFELVKRGRKAHSIRFQFTKRMVENYKAKEEKIKIFLTTKQIEDLRVSCGLENEQFTDVELVDLYEIAISKAERYDLEVYDYMRLNYQYMAEQLADTPSKSRRYGYYQKALSNHYANHFTP